MSADSSSGIKTHRSTLLWGVFCACSWTWCIGMYLPRIMIDRFGWPGFIAFAIPNVLGCAAFGYIVRRRARSESLVQSHAPAMVWFSVITIAYQVFFAVWLFAEILPNLRDYVGLPIVTGAIVYAMALVLSFFNDRDFLVLTALVYGVSLWTLLAVGFDAIQLIGWEGQQPRSELFWLTPTIIFGFLLCPYLDLTFHRALQRSPSRHAFAVFGITFAIMILLTCLIWFSPGVARFVPAIVIAHLLAQLVFTAGAHMREIRTAPTIRTINVRLAAMLAPAAAIPLLDLVRGFDNHTSGEGVYLRFIVFYALVFPAYVLLFMTPSKVAISRRFKIAVGLVILASLRLYELGFMHQRAWLMTIPLAVFVALRVLRSRFDDRAFKTAKST